jgi:hypothetical protein|tara:strand:- start:6031 stop:6261 length:231 start_codon:yes stop_codon:yes gene_type:complete
MAEESKRWNVVVGIPNKKSGKTYWHKVGSAFPNAKGGFDVNLDSYPVPQYSDEYGLSCRLSIFPAENKGSGSDAPF